MESNEKKEGKEGQNAQIKNEEEQKVFDFRSVSLSKLKSQIEESDNLAVLIL